MNCPSRTDALIEDGMNQSPNAFAPDITTRSDFGQIANARLQRDHRVGVGGDETLVDISLSQDAEVGDGTTSVVLMGAEFMRQAKPFIEENMHPQMIIKSFRKAGQLAVQKIKDIEVRVADSDEVGRRQMLERVSGTALNSKLISRHKQFFSPMVRVFFFFFLAILLYCTKLIIVVAV